MVRIIALLLLFTTAWVLFSLDLTPLSIVLGFLFSGLVVAGLGPAWKRVRKRTSDTHPLVAFGKRFAWLLVYMVWIVIQSFVGSFLLIRLMLTGRYKPGVVRIRTRLTSPFARVLLANTISLIPGTMTLWMDGRHLFVHCFDLPSSHAVKAGRIIKEDIETMLGRVFG